MTHFAHLSTLPARALARGFRLIWAALTLLMLLVATMPAQADPAQGPGGPLLVLTSPSAPFRQFHAEILRTEGFNAFAVQDLDTLTPQLLAGHDLVILAKVALTPAQVTILSDWVSAGGNLIAMAPDAQLAPLLGLTPENTTLSDAYLKVDTATAPGNGIVGQTIQYHGTADRYLLSGATALATLYSSPSTPTVYPAVTLRNVGSGKAAAFAFDLATSVVLTRQGNPAWAAQERDGLSPIRSDDKFYGAAAGDPQADWVDLTRVAIPQADEQQRLLANLIQLMNGGVKPLPRFWYFPNGKKAVVVMTGDDHGNGGTIGRFEQFKAASPAGCSVANWECVRGTSYIYPNTPMSDAQAAAYTAEGFEVGLHINTSCADYTPASLEDTYVSEIADWTAKYASVPAPVTQRHHCIVWSDWATGAQVQFNHGMRLDTSYYYWPAAWANNTPGLFTGSAMPMRFSALDGSLIDVFQVATQMTDESGQSYPYTVDTLLDRALGSEGYYGAYTVNAHTDVATMVESDTVVASAQARGVPVVSSRQMLTWLDARNSSSFGSLNWNGSTLSFTITAGVGANGLQAMVPVQAAGKVLGAISRGAVPVTYTVQAIKGVEYAFFAADNGSYLASYAADAGAPTVSSATPASGATGVALTTAVTVTFSEAMDPATVGAASMSLTAGGQAVAASVSYDAGTRTARLVPTSALATSTAYTVALTGVKDLAGNALAGVASWSFTTTATPLPTCPCGGWSAATLPATASVSDANPVEVGVKFRTEVDGFVTGVRFYKGPANTGTHIGNLWTQGGQLLGTATFANETATGWQEVTFANPVAVTANTVYVASYFAPSGGYAADPQYFASQGVSRSPVYILGSNEAGGNGVFSYSPSSTFPVSSFGATNYWVDVAFVKDAPPDTTPPTVTATLPASGATGIGTASVVTATFSEPLDPLTVNANTVELRTDAGSLVPGTLTYDAATRTVTLEPAALLTPSTVYTVTLRGGGSDPRLKDPAGNALAASQVWSFTTAAGGSNCVSPANAIVGENCLVGNPASEWDISGVGDPSLQGFATQISVNRGNTVFFKVKSTASAYRLDIYRMGYYAGLGARKVATVLPSASLPQTQPACLSDGATGLVDCGNWAVSASWQVPTTAVSGIYFAKLVRTDTGGSSHVFFVVRNDASTSDLIFQTSDTTWQAYNTYGGNSLYTGSPAGRAYKVSYNRPFATRGVDNGQDWVFNSEYPMVRWLEANGYDVSYQSGVDTDRLGNLLLNHRTFLSVGHDEYWSGNQRAQVEAARNAGVNLAFFSGNEIFWKTRWEPSIDGSGTPYRTLVSYKETHANAKIDPSAEWTGTWRDPRFSPPADGGRPENALSGTLFMVNAGATSGITVPAADGKMRFWRNTSMATLPANGSATLPVGTLGYEWDIDADNGSRPAGLFRLSTTTVNGAPVLQDQGSNYASGTATHALTFYKHASGAKVFGAGTVQWAWGLDAVHDRAGTPADARMRQATVNLLADLGAQPATLRSGLVAAVASTDVVPPTSTVTSPLAGATLPYGTSVTVTGTASDAGGGVVGGVEVSVDGGATWRRANGRESWSFTWLTSASGSVTVRSRAVDDSGNLETPSAGLLVTVGAPQTCPCTIWPAAAAPTVASANDTASVNVGVKFRADQNGFITGIRFYKGPGNTGNHVGALWTAAGQQLATVNFTSETSSGWQQADFATPVAVTANTVYVASYLAPNGGYAGDGGYFSGAGFDRVPLHALANGESGGNGVYAYASGLAFPNSTFNASNYWVDVVFMNQSADTTPPTVATVSPPAGATGISRSTTVSATFSEAMDAASISAASFELRDASSQLVPATVTYNAATFVATLTPTAALPGSTVFTARVKGGSTDPRVKDSAGNALATDRIWSFTTSPADTTPPTVTVTTPNGGSINVDRATTVAATFSEDIDPATVTTSTFFLQDPALVTVPATVSYNVLTRVATLVPNSPLAASTLFSVTVKGGGTDPRIKDLAGNALAANRRWSFTTAGSDTVPPTVTVTFPNGGSTGVSPSTVVQATFSEALDPATVTTSTFFLKDPNGVLVASTVAYDTATKVATLTPTARLADLTLFTVTVKGGGADPRVKDLAGNPLASNRVWSFTTGASDTTPPTVTAVTPKGGSTGVALNTVVTATFSEAVDPATVNASTFFLTHPSGGTVAATVAYNAGTRVATLTPSAPLAGGVQYTATVKGGAADPRVKDLAGNALATNRKWSFTTLAGDTTPPAVTSVSPAAGATGVSRSANVTADFDEALDAATVSSTTFELRATANGQLVAATVTYNATSRRAVLNPNAKLPALTSFTATLLGGSDPRIKDVAGNGLAAPQVWSFTTGP